MAHAIIRPGPPEMGRIAEQTTLARPVTKKGIGLHTGVMCTVSLLPAEDNAGIVFVSESGRIIPATAERVVDTQRGTTLGDGTVTIGCVEHLMAAFFGVGVDNVSVEVTGPEIPACDGSAREWVQALSDAGIKHSGRQILLPAVQEGIWIENGLAYLVAVPSQSDLTLSVGVDFEDTVAGRQMVSMRLTRRRFEREIAPARTFVMADELESLRARGLAQGGSELNAFAVGKASYSGPLRFDDEVVRHKALDLVGDIALCGRHFFGHIIAIRPSHDANVALARALRKAFEH